MSGLMYEPASLWFHGAAETDRGDEGATHAAADADADAPSPSPASDGSGSAGHIATAELVPLYSWGSAAEPSPPSIDSNETVFYDDNDSGVGTFRSSTASINSSVYHFIEENGRTYHRYKDGKYHFPNDAEEQDRLNVQHALFLMTVQGKLFLAPIGPHVHRALDIGTGTGVWAIEFADQHPGAEVLGTDLSPIQPDFVPPNCRFEIDDADDEWAYTACFDFIHARAMCSCFTDHKRVIQSCYESLVPGGWCEWQDMLFPLRPARPLGPNETPPAIITWTEKICEAAERIGRSWSNVDRYKRYFDEVGFVNVVEKRFYWPVGFWARGDYYKSLAAYFLDDIRRGMEPISYKLLPMLGMSSDDIENMLADVRDDLKNPNIHAYLQVVFVYGQKPANARPE